MRFHVLFEKFILDTNHNSPSLPISYSSSPIPAARKSKASHVESMMPGTSSWGGISPSPLHQGWVRYPMDWKKPAHAPRIDSGSTDKCPTIWPNHTVAVYVQRTWLGPMQSLLLSVHSTQGPKSSVLFWISPPSSWLRSPAPRTPPPSL